MVHAEIVWQYAGKLASGDLPLEALPGLLAREGLVRAASARAAVLRSVDLHLLGRPARDLARLELAPAPPGLVTGGGATLLEGFLTFHRNGAFVVELRARGGFAPARLAEMVRLAVRGRRDAAGPSPYGHATEIARRLDGLVEPWTVPGARGFDGELEVQSVGIVGAPARVLDDLRRRDSAVLAAFANLDSHFATRRDAATAANFAVDLSVDTEVSVHPAQNALLVLLDVDQREAWLAHTAGRAGTEVPDDVRDRVVAANYVCFAEWALLEVATAEHFLRWYGDVLSRRPEPLLDLRERAVRETLAVRDFPKERQHGVRVADAVRSVRHLDETYVRTERRRALLESIAGDRVQRRQDRIIRLVSLVALGTVGWNAAELYVQASDVAEGSREWVLAKGTGVGSGVAVFVVAFAGHVLAWSRLTLARAARALARRRVVRTGR